MFKEEARLIYVSPFYYGLGVSSFGPLLPDPVLVDWQLRLLSFLVNQGYSIHAKQHPECLTSMDSFFFTELGIKNIKGRMEKVINKEDILIFDFNSTTSFGFCIKNGNPIVLVDFKFVSLRKKEDDLLRKRVSIVDGFFCRKNRAEIEWNLLPQAIENSKSLKDKTYQKLVLGET